MFPEYGLRLCPRIVQAEFLRRHGGVLQLLRIPYDEGERHAGLRQKLAPPGDWEARMMGGSMEGEPIVNIY